MVTAMGMAITMGRGNKGKYMRFVIDNGGQTCNKFWSYLEPLDKAIEGHKISYILIPDKDLLNYPNLTSNEYIKFPFWSKSLSKIIGGGLYEKIVRYFVSPFVKIDRRFHLGLFRYGWESRLYHVSESHRPIIKEIFTPGKNIRDKVDKLFESSIKGHKLVIGLHVRKGDYKYWLGGKYYFSDSEYNCVCKTIKKKFPDVMFFIASNEKISKEMTSDLEYFSNIDGSAPEDLYALSKCDYILGPPSTFSYWAGFYGNKFIEYIEDPVNFSPSYNIGDTFRYIDRE